MSNELTQAVRRLRQLQEDVERLKSGGNQGEVRELRSVDAGVDVSDSVVVGPDADVVETVGIGETVAVGPAADVTDGTATTDAVDARVSDAAASDGTTTSDTATVQNVQAATPAVCDFDNADKSDAG